MVNITKNLQIQSKDQAYKLINQYDDLLENILFIPFMDSMNDHYYGCRCDADRFDELSNVEFSKLDNTKVTEFLKDYFKCDSVFFLK